MSAAPAQHAPVPAAIRPARWEDRGAVLELLSGADFRSGVSDVVFDRLFTYHWLAPKPNFGFVLAAEERIVGYAGGAYSRRNVNGRTVRIGGMGTLYLDAAYRVGGAANPSGVQYAKHMIEMAISQKGWTFVALTPNTAAAAILFRLHFRSVSKARSLFAPDWRMAYSVLRTRHVHSDPCDVLSMLPEEQRTIACDHLLYGCGCYAVECDGEYSLVVTKRSHVPRAAVLGSVPLAAARSGHLPASLVLYFGNKEAARARWRELVARILLAEGTAALLVFDWMVPAGIEKAHSIPRRAAMLGTDLDASEIDAAYSEITLF